LQIDTIHVVARSPYLVLFSRLGDYKPAWLDELLAEGKLFEYWSHAACFLPIEDYPLYVSRMIKHIQRYYTPEWGAQNNETVELVMQRIREGGPVRSADFERSDGKKGTWWDWKVEKRVLEYLFTIGDLMIARRDKFQRVYDLRERVLPGWDGTPPPELEAAQDELAIRTVRILGAAPARWIPDYFRLPKPGMPQRLKRLAEAGQIQEIAVEGWKDAWYIHPDNRTLLESALNGAITPRYTTLLSPFDPLIWDRERARVLFNFDFSLECYLPQPKRHYGYFVLPILHAGQLIGRLDAKAHRKGGRFEVRALYLEPAAPLNEETAAAVAAAIQRCADWHATPRVEILRSDPPVFAGMVQRCLES
ncbi:MAG TPA: crosslink repair DNA glycosylase YcaQ family protein, partial [Anaerolineaceae bacterium]